MSVIVCPVCGSNKVKHKVLTSRDNEQLKLIACSNCGHLAQNPDDYEDIYTSGEFSVIAREGKNQPSADKIKSLDKRALSRYHYFEDIIDGTDNILEVGSSIGSFVHLLKLRGKKAAGLEPDPDYSAYSEQQYGFSQSSELLEQYKPEAKFDAIFAFHVLEHVEDPKAFIDSALSLLNDNGKVLLEFPSYELHSYGSMKHTIWKPHIHYFNVASIYHLLSQNFEVLELGYYGSAIFVYAQKTNAPTFNSSRFARLKIRSKVNYWICKLFPSIPKKKVGTITAKQLLLQSLVFQRNKGQLFKKLFKFSIFGVKNLLYLRKEKKSGDKVTHISYYSGWENAGDTILSKCVRETFSHQLKISWNLQQLTAAVDKKSIDHINKSKFFVLGGGGVLLPDSNPNTISGWQWAASKDQISSINVPIIIFAIGYNYFKGQEPNQLFTDNLKHIVNKADFFGVRNHGSINSIKQLIGEDLGSKIRFQPCPTTIIRNLHPDLTPKKTSRNVAVNIAYDRYRNRFGKDINLILDQIASALKSLEQEGYKIYNACHLENDAKFELSLDKFGVNYETIHMQYMLPKACYDFYNEMELVMGMRGHAQMVPFGLNCKIISLGSHNKLRWFLEDIDALDWLVDLNEQPQLIAEEIVSKSLSLLTDKTSVIQDRLIEKQNYLYQVTLDNLELIKSKIE
ncbi:MAG: polysaccharide pyruvyl transferase family protein [Bacteroidota bacterium]